ncbi:MAG: excinuclease ABC subunit UvrC [Clostridiales bacterium]|nr:excinuclease ABC subunit UvrC [Clostridiales bacterium]
MTKDELRQKAHSLPLEPGVYIMMDAAGEVIYVGKSRALRNRVSQYFADLASHTPKTRAMVAQIDHFDYLLASSEFEALVLENSLIKRHKPRYNILLKDDKGYPYIRLSNGEYPRFSLATRPAKDGAKYFGPYGGRSATAESIKAICNALRLPTCRRQFPRDIGKERPCLNHHLGICDGWCQGRLTQADYQERIYQAERLLEGKFTQVEQELKREMLRASEELRFEEAAELRDRLQAIELLGTKQRVVASSRADTDVAGFYRGEAKSCFVVLHFLEGALADRDTQLMPNPMEEDDGEVVSTLVKQYYLNRSALPREILLPGEFEDMEELGEYLSRQAERKVTLSAPKRGDRVRLVELAERTARDEVERATTAQERQSKLVELLGRTLGMDHPPRRIEAYDISNTGSANIVASMTVFVDGKPLKRDYRRFKLRDMEHPDDYASMEQVLTRRFRRYLEGDEKFDQLPDLILMDGGQGQVKVAVQVLEGMGLSVPVFGMVKDGRHRTRALVAPGGREIGIQQNQALFSMVGRIQEETHRFAITFHRESHARQTVASSLEEIPGVGEARRKALLKQFKTVKGIREASEEELAAVIPKNTARAVYLHFHKEEHET